jgi:hypothetical protein
MWSSDIQHDYLGVVWNNCSLQAELLVKLTVNPILQACPELIHGALSLVLSTSFSTLCLKFAIHSSSGNFATTSRTYLLASTEGQVPKISVNAMLKASSNDQHFVVHSKISLDPEIKLEVIYIYIYMRYFFTVCSILHLHTNCQFHWFVHITFVERREM